MTVFIVLVERRIGVFPSLGLGAMTTVLMLFLSVFLKDQRHYGFAARSSYSTAMTRLDAGPYRASQASRGRLPHDLS
jgi:hypothetical protein